MSTGPAARPPAPGWTAPPITEADGRALVLYVDIDETSFETSKKRLRQAYKLLRARQDREACQLIREHHAELVAVLMDVDLPGSVLDGVLLTRILRGRIPPNALPPFARDLPCPDVPIVLVTQNPDRYAERDMVRHGGDRLMAKPVELHALTLTLAEWHLQRA